MFSKGSWSRRIAIGSVGTAVIGGGAGAMLYRRRMQENRSVTAESFNASQDQVELSAALKTIFTSKDSQAIVKLYRYTTCPWCGTVKAFLDYFHIEHELVEVEPMFKSQLAFVPYKKVPQVQFIMTGHWGPLVVDSDLIIRTLAPYVGVQKQLDDKEIKKWRSFARDDLVRLLVLDINRSLSEAWHAYSYIDDFDTIPYANKLFLKVMGAPVMYLVAKLKTKPALLAAGKIKEGDNVREKLMERIALFANEGLAVSSTFSSRNFHGGSKPDLADLDVYGVLQSIRGHHIYDDILTKTQIGDWLSRMDKATGKEVYVVPELRSS